jgi:hypothetical protein
MGQAVVSCSGDCSCGETVIDGMSKDTRFKVGYQPGSTPGMAEQQHIMKTLLNNRPYHGLVMLCCSQATTPLLHVFGMARNWSGNSGQDCTVTVKVGGHNTASMDIGSSADGGVLLGLLYDAPAYHCCKPLAAGCESKIPFAIRPSMNALTPYAGTGQYKERWSQVQGDRHHNLNQCRQVS